MFGARVRAHVLGKKPVRGFFEYRLWVVFFKMFSAKRAHAVCDNLLHQRLLFGRASVFYIKARFIFHTYTATGISFIAGCGS